MVEFGWSGLCIFGLLFMGHSGSNVTMSGVRVEDGGAIKPSLISIREGRKVVPIIRCYSSDCTIKNSVIVPRMGHAIETFTGKVHNVLTWQSFVGLRVGGTAELVNNVIYGATQGDPLGDGEIEPGHARSSARECGTQRTHPRAHVSARRRRVCFSRGAAHAK